MSDWPRDVVLEWLLLGTTLGVDATGQAFLVSSALLWLLAAWFARAWLAADATRGRFFGFFLAAAAGNIGVCIARDVASFYFFFSLMTFSAAGLVLHRRTAAARRAGAVYLVAAILGEAALLVALLLIAAGGGLAMADAPAAVAASPWRDAIVALLLAGFGVKTGVLGLHVALPLAYGAAPAPGAAVLASAMINAGLLGWLRFLPLGHAAPEWSAAFVALGIAAAFYGALIGLVQREPKVILAYSSISQMGLVTVAVGLGLAAPAAQAPALAAATLYALHHALAKGALFLGEGLARTARSRGWILAGLALACAALAGAPFTSGALAKHYFKDLLAFAPWPQGLPALLAATAVGTTLLMLRFLWQVWHAPLEPAGARAQGLALPWLIALALVLALPLGREPPIAAAVLYAAAGPVLLGVLVAAAALRIRWRIALTVPPGDVLVPIERAIHKLAGLGHPSFAVPAPRGLAIDVVVGGTERALRSWRAVGALLLGLLGLFAILLAFG